MLRRRLVVLLALVFVGELGCNAKSPTAPSPPGLLTAVVGGCTYKLDPSGLPATIPASGGTFNVELTTAAGCPWSVQVPTLPYPVVDSSPGQGTGSKSIALTVYAHMGTQDRKIDVTVASMTLSRNQTAGGMPVAGPNAILVYSGTAGEALSYGQTSVATTDQYSVKSLEFGALPVYLTLDALGPSPAWPRNFTIIMQAANRTPLSPGVYTDLVRWLGLNGPTNTASVTINSFNCDVASSSSFEILDIARNGDGTLNRVHFKMLYRCATDPPTSLLTLEGWYPSKGAF